MIVVPIYNKQLIPNGKMYFQKDEFVKLGRRAVQGERVVLIQCRTYQDRDKMTEDNFYPIGAVGVLSTISSDGYVVVEASGRVNIDEVALDAAKKIELTISRRNDTDTADPAEEQKILARLKEDVKDLSSRFQFSSRETASRLKRKRFSFTQSRARQNRRNASFRPQWLRILNEGKEAREISPWSRLKFGSRFLR